MKLETRTATKMCLPIHAQEPLELIVDYFNIWIFAHEEIDMKEAIQIELHRQTTTPQ